MKTKKAGHDHDGLPTPSERLTEVTALTGVVAGGIVGAIGGPVVAEDLAAGRPSVMVAMISTSSGMCNNERSAASTASTAPGSSTRSGTSAPMPTAAGSW